MQVHACMGFFVLFPDITSTYWFVPSLIAYFGYANFLGEEMMDDTQGRHILGIPEMDEQHRYLYSLFDRIEDSATVLDQRSCATLLKEIEGYLLFHFNCEEHLIRLYNAPGFAAHQTEHEQAGARLVRFLDDFESGCLNPARLRFFLSGWLAEHSLLCDEQYAAAIRKMRGAE